MLRSGATCDDLYCLVVLRRTGPRYAKVYPHYFLSDESDDAEMRLQHREIATS